MTARGLWPSRFFSPARMPSRMPPKRAHGPVRSQHDDIREYVRSTLDNSSPLNSLIESAVGYSPTIYEITISDKNGTVLVSSDASQRGQKVPVRPERRLLVAPALFISSARFMARRRPTSTRCRSALGSGPFGDIRIGLSSTLMRDEISPGLRSAVYWALGVGIAVHFAGAPRQPDHAGAARAHFEAIGSHLGGRI